MTATMPSAVHGLCHVCSTNVFTVLVGGQRTVLDRPPSPAGDVFVRFDADPIVGVIRTAIDLTDPFDDGTRYVIHQCPTGVCSMCHVDIDPDDWSGWVTLTGEHVCDSCAPSTAPNVDTDLQLVAG
jgi:hypothetical protein